LREVSFETVKSTNSFWPHGETRFCGKRQLVSIDGLTDLYDQSMERTSFTLVILAVAGGMALVLGIVGIYGKWRLGRSDQRGRVDRAVKAWLRSGGD
jgi:hypothetical protein